MAFQNSDNASRVNKILQALDLIEKSAESNKATEDELKAMLGPVLERLYGPSEEEPTATDVQRQAERPPTAADNGYREPTFPEHLLALALRALNKPARFPLDSGRYADSYELASAISIELKSRNVAAYSDLGPIPRPGSHAAFNSIREAAEKAELADFTMAISIFVDRLYEHFGE